MKTKTDNLSSSSSSSFSPATTPLPVNVNAFGKPFITAYGPKRKIKLSFPPDEGRTKQSFKDECDVNVIMRRYQQTGVLPGRDLQSIYADLSDPNMVDFHQAMMVVARARSAFEELPSELRARFNNDPGELIAFLDDDKNREEAVELGLVNATAKPPAAPVTGGASAPTPPAAGAASGDPKPVSGQK